MKVEIYTNDKCINCVKVKEYLDKNNVEYLEYNISRNSEARKELIGMGYMSVPLTIVNKNHILGFDLNRMNELLGK